MDSCVVGKGCGSRTQVVVGWMAGWVAWPLRWDFPEADAEMRIHVRVILKEAPLGEQRKEPGQGREGSQAGVSSHAKSQRGRGFWEISLPPSGANPLLARELGLHAPLPLAITYGHWVWSRWGAEMVQRISGSGRGPDVQSHTCPLELRGQHIENRFAIVHVGKQHLRLF